MYNVVLFKYKNSLQLRIYQFPISELKREEKESFADSYDVAEKEIDNSFIPDPDNKYVFEGRSHYVSVNHSKNKIFYYSRSVDWSGGWFVTLTIDPNKYNRTDYRSCVDYLRYFLDNLRKYDSSIKYLFVPELHKKGGYHFHGLITRCNLERDGIIEDSGHTILGDKIYNLKRFWKFGFTTLSRIKNSLAVEKYIAKYTTKELLNDTKYQHRYFVSQNIEGAEILKYNFMNRDLLEELLSNNLVTYTNTDGSYNRVTYLECKNDPKIFKILEELQK